MTVCSMLVLLSFSSCKRISDNIASAMVGIIFDPIAGQHIMDAEKGDLGARFTISGEKYSYLEPSSLSHKGPIQIAFYIIIDSESQSCVGYGIGYDYGFNYMHFVNEERSERYSLSPLIQYSQADPIEDGCTIAESVIFTEDGKHSKIMYSLPDDTQEYCPGTGTYQIKHINHDKHRIEIEFSIDLTKPNGDKVEIRDGFMRLEYYESEVSAEWWNYYMEHPYS